MHDFYDMHCHLGFAADPAGFAEAGDALSMAFFSTTVTPSEFEEYREGMQRMPNVAWGLGLHPWRIGGNRSENDGLMEAFEARFPTTPYIGEVGLDFSKKCVDSAGEQERMFRRVARLCAAEGGKLLSIHSVRSAGRIIEILEEERVLDSCACIFHWFSGNSQELHDAVNSGIYFSAGTRMLETRKGREYARQLPLRLLMLETDLPPENNKGIVYDASVQLGHLRGALALLGEARPKDDPLLVKDTVRRTSSRLLSLDF